MAAEYAHLHIITNNPTKYESNPASGYRGEAVTRIGLTDGQTDGRTGQKHYTPRNFVAWGIIIFTFHSLIGLIFSK